MMKRLLAIVAIVFLCAGCWMFEKTDDRPAPIVDAATQAVEAFSEAGDSTPLVSPIGGIIVGGVAAISAFISTLVNRRKELGKKVAK